MIDIFINYLFIFSIHFNLKILQDFNLVMNNESYLTKSITSPRRRLNPLDRDLSPKLKNSPYLEPPQKALPPKPLNKAEQKTHNRNTKYKNPNQDIQYYNSYYSSLKYQQIFPGYTSTPRKIFRPYQKGQSNQYTHLSRSLNTQSSNFDLCYDEKYTEKQKKSPYNENHLKTHRLAKIRTELKMKEQREKERQERNRTNIEATEAIQIEKENEKETNDLVFAKHDHSIRIIPSFDRTNEKI